jgi:hypothetical protein
MNISDYIKEKSSPRIRLLFWIVVFAIIIDGLIEAFKTGRF